MGEDPLLARRAFLAATAAGFVPVSAMAAAGGTPPGSITDIEGVRVGHYTETRRPTGCTVVLFDAPAVAGVDVRGSAPGTRETDLLNPLNSVQAVNAILLSGGSAYGLDAASGVMRYLEERNIGFRVGAAVVPIVPAAILFDLNIGDPKIHPDAAAGYAACEAATHSETPEGSIGAGAGATVGKLFGMSLAMKSGIGSASWTVPESGLSVGALVVVNAAGDVRDSKTGEILAGARDPNGPGMLDSMRQWMNGAPAKAHRGSNTTIGVVATNAVLTKVEATKIAQMAHDGLARTINPVHTLLDGDTIFAAGTGRSRVSHDPSLIGAIAAEVMAQAVNRAVITASALPGFPSHREFLKPQH
jgi:L-aminopeptidase/D-esterase-like protein